MRTAFTGEGTPFGRRLLVCLGSLAVATGLWLPCVHLFFTPDVEVWFAEAGMAPRAKALAAWQLRGWRRPELRRAELRKMRGNNAEWDFMGRTFLVLALANMAEREPPAAPEYLDIVDAIVDETLRLEAERGMYHFLMDYATGRPYVAQPARSLFIDGEIALMLGARRLVEDEPRYRRPFRKRISAIVASMSRSPLLTAESYPDECWMFDHVNALAAIRIGDALDGTDHSEFIRRWLRTAKKRLTHDETGLLISSWFYDGTHKQGPEGSTIWMVAHALQLVDPAFARDQYERAERELVERVLGFAYAREWPDSWQGLMDIDSGPIIPGVGASAGSSGLAFVGASAFGDRPLLRGLLTSLDFAAFPVERAGGLRYAASNQVGDAVLLYATVQGPLWRKVRQELPR
ncbi:MAG: hypothetical protein R6V58_12550 [Planctomycetota bacterium]